LLSEFRLHHLLHSIFLKAESRYWLMKNQSSPKFMIQRHFTLSSSLIEVVQCGAIELRKPKKHWFSSFAVYLKDVCSQSSTTVQHNHIYIRRTIKKSFMSTMRKMPYLQLPRLRSMKQTLVELTSPNLWRWQ
jgi:hypothetical protein